MQSDADGGCCGEDGFRSSNGSCASCSPQGNSYDFMCSNCFEGSKCNARDRAEAADATCEASGCRGGCLMGDECVYNISQVDCNRQRKTWCQACSIAVFDMCYEWADCYAVCSGCCGTATGDCPVAPYPMNIEGPCAPCEHRPPQCEACFPESICTTEYSESKYGSIVKTIMDNYVNPWAVSAESAEESTSSATSATTLAATTQPTTASAAAQVSTTSTTVSTTTAPSTSLVANVTVERVDQVEETEEHTSAGGRVASMLAVSLFVPCWFACFSA